MPVSIDKIKKISTPRLDLYPGVYPARIVAMVYSKKGNPRGKRVQGEYLLQVRAVDDVCYVATRPFTVSINEGSPLCGLLCGLTGTRGSDELFDWLDTNEYFKDGMFDECDFIGVPLMATIDRAARRGAPQMTYNVVTGFAPIAESVVPELDTNRLIPYSFARPDRYEIEKLPELDIDEP